MIFAPLLEGGTTHLAVMVIRLMVLLLLGVYLWGGIRAGTLPMPSLRIGPAVLTFLGIAAVSVAASPYIDQSLQWLLVLLSYGGLLYLLVSFIVQWDHISKLLAVLVGMGLFEAGWALVQAGWSGRVRPSGTFFNPNFLAGYLVVIWAIMLGYLFYARLGQGDQSGLLNTRWFRLSRQVGTVAVPILLLLAIVQTGSRGALLALLVSTSLVVGLRFGRRGVGVLLLCLLLGVLVPNQLRDRLWAEHMANPVGYARWQMWQGSIQAMAEHPFGVGLGLYQYVYPRYAFPVEGQIARFGKIAQTPHNEYLQIGVELGVASLLVFGWGLARIAREAVEVLRLQIIQWQRGVVVGVSAGIAGMLVHAAVDSNLHEPALAIQLTLCVAIILSVRRLSGAVTEPLRGVFIRSRRSKFVWTVVGLAVVAVLTLGVIRLGLAWMAFEDGTRAAAKKDFIQAISQYQTAVALDSGKALYHSSLAAAYFQVFEQTRDRAAAQAAVDELQSAIQLNPLDGRLPGLLGHVYVRLSSSLSPSEPYSELRKSWLRSALSAYERATDLEPYAPFYCLERGRLHLELGDRDQAEGAVRRAVEIEPNFLPGREFLAKLYLDAGQPELATREYQQIIERQQRYAGWNKDSYEERFLKADASALAAELERIRALT
ncbi:MAG: O-antigen ligase family protein [Nitrospiraceae bacterium]